MHLAILGATSQLAKDFVAQADAMDGWRCSLFARRPEAVRGWSAQLQRVRQVENFAAFGSHESYDAVINFVGVGNPAAARALGTSILDITQEFDALALNYLRARPKARYIFISSGVAYGSDFREPVAEDRPATFDINRLKPEDWYGIAKLYAECRHRALPQLPIVDVRVFNYFSRSQDLSARFLITDMLRAITEKAVLTVSPDYIVRDFIHPSDFFRLIEAILCAPENNTALDCYTKAPVDKPTLLATMAVEFGLRYVAGKNAAIEATGRKVRYFSLNRRAAEFGYQPSLSSLEGVIREARAVLQR